jgi:hypothetical protein
VESPKAFEAVDEHTLLFAVHMYRPIYEKALEKALPAAFVGTGWNTWDDVGNLKEGEFACMREMHESHRLLPFPQDGSHTTFSSTCLYWAPRAEVSVSENAQGQSVEEKAGEASKTRAASDTIEKSETGKAEKSAPVSEKAAEPSPSETLPS